MEFLKGYQVAEHKNGKWSVVMIEDQMICGAALRAVLTMRVGQFETAAEAQELADQLNEQEQDK